MSFIKLLGAASIAAFAFTVGVRYSRFLDKKLSQYSGFISLSSHIEREIERNLSYGSELFASFSNSALESCGFLREIRRGADVKSAFFSSIDSLLLSKTAIDRLSAFFSSFGRDYKERELKKLASLRETLEEERAMLAPEIEKNKKTALALLFGAAASVLIILI